LIFLVNTYPLARFDSYEFNKRALCGTNNSLLWKAR